MGVYDDNMGDIVKTKNPRSSGLNRRRIGIIGYGNLGNHQSWATGMSCKHDLLSPSVQVHLTVNNCDYTTVINNCDCTTIKDSLKKIVTSLWLK